MPTYEYQCQACKAIYELRQGFDAETTHVCEECGKGTAKRVLHAPPVVFKGSGWYVTDSKSKNSALKDSDSNSKSDASESKAVETTPSPESKTTTSESAAAS